jgi:tryptophan halogenase
MAAAVHRLPTFTGGRDRKVQAIMNRTAATGPYDLWADKLGALAAEMPEADGQLLSSLLPDETRPRAQAWRPPAPNKERAHLGPRDRRPADDDPHGIRRVGVIGGGTAGYLTALALRAQMPWLDVTLVESSKIPIIGVGEATTPPLTQFLHHYLGIDPVDFQRKVRPAWKLGIRFDWGRNPAGFMAPFDWGHNSVGLLGSQAFQGDPNAGTLLSLFMLADRTPVFRLASGEYLSMLDALPFAYHLENRSFVRYLTDVAAERGVRHIDAEISHVELQGEEWVRSLSTTDGRNLEFDLYIDCTGFRSLLLGKTLGTKYISYSSSLFNDTALTGHAPQGETMGPYTRATTMNAGWCWTIPVPEENHVGYVHSSAFLSEDAAAAELERTHPGVTNVKTVRFRVGRHEKAWRGNVIAMGNAYGFVEPLESSALLMLLFTNLAMIPLLPTSWKRPNASAVFNELTARRWDDLRSFLAIHFRFNSRLDTDYWREVRATTDVSGIQPILDVYENGAPMQLRDGITRRVLRAAAPTFFELEGVDWILLGQGVPCELLTTREPEAAWRRRKAAADVLVRRGLPQREALEVYRNHPELTETLVYGSHSWVGGYGPEGWIRASKV